jgi:hypothetical protein
VNMHLPLGHTVVLLSCLLCGAGCAESTSPNDDGKGNPSSDCPQSDAFMDISNVDGPGTGYADPELTVTCLDESVIVQSNGMPHYTFQPMTPNPLQEQAFDWSFPRYPEVAASPTEIPLLGTAGVAINGIPIYGPNEGPQPDPFGDPIYNNLLDWCMGHTGGNGDYHYHALLESCLAEAVSSGETSPILGYAMDGFPVYGPTGCVDESCTAVVEFKSSWEQIGDPETYVWDAYACTQSSCDEADGEYLDACNGRVGPDGSYRYHATADFPYILGCYAGTASDSSGDGAPGGGGGPPGGGPP